MLTSFARDKVMPIYQWLFLSCLAIAYIGILYSTFLFGMTYFLFAGLMLLCVLGTPDLKGRLRERGHFWYLGLTLLWFPFALSGLWSEDLPYWLSRVRIKLPFLVFPILAYFMPRLNRQFWLRCLFLIVGISVLSTIPVLLYLLSSDTSITGLIHSGKTIPTPVDHVRYSMILCSSALFSFILPFEGHISKQWHKLLFYVISIYLALTLHLLAVRTGLLGLYLILPAYLVYDSIRSGKIRGLILLVYLGVVPIIAVKIPTVKAKLAYLSETIIMTQVGHSGNLYSDSDRLLSMKLGIQAAQESPLLGVGAGDIMAAMRAEYREYPERDKILAPHNQFIAYFLGTGLFGLGIMIIGLAIFFFGCKVYNDSFLLAHFTFILYTSLIDTTFDIALGIALFSYPIFAGILHHYGLRVEAGPETPSLDADTQVA